MQQRTSDLVLKTSITNNLSTAQRTTGFVLDARQGKILDDKIAGLEATKANLNFITDPFAQFTAVQGQYYVYSDILYKRTGTSVGTFANGNLYEGASGWTYVLGATFFDGFITYGDHTFSNDSRWVKYQKGVNGQKAIRGQIWYTDGKAYRYVNTQSANGIGILINGDGEFTNDKSKWEPIIYPTVTFTPAAIKSALPAASSNWTNGEFTGATPAGSVPGMKFCDQYFRYEFMNGMNDTDGTTYIWVRNPK